MAYHRVRTDRLEETCWKGEDVLDRQMENSQISQDQPQQRDQAGEGGSLSPEEEEYVRLYGELLAGLKGQWTDVDLTGSLEPPKDLFIDVRVLRDAGEIQTEYG